MRLAWAKTKKMDELDPSIHCCEESAAFSKDAESVLLVVDLDDVRPCEYFACHFCGAPSSFREGVRIHSSEVPESLERYNYVFLDSIDVQEGEFDPNVVPESNSTV